MELAMSETPRPNPNPYIVDSPTQAGESRRSIALTGQLPELKGGGKDAN